MLIYAIGLDTSTILRWLVLQGYEVVCFLADCGQEEDFDAVKEKAIKLGAERMIIENVQQELIDELVWPAIQCMFTCFDLRVSLTHLLTLEIYRQRHLRGPM
jgi:argininosuccinate synthase